MDPMVTSILTSPKQKTMASSVGETPMSNSRALADAPAEAKKNENDTHLILRYGKAQKMANPAGIHHGALDAPVGTSNAQRWFVINGKTIDIHPGGGTHVPNDHENEIAQSETANDAPLALFGCTTAWSMWAAQRCRNRLATSQPSVHFSTVGVSSMTLRLFVLQAHYRKPLTSQRMP